MVVLLAWLKVTERVISDDLNFLISKAVDISKADYAGDYVIGYDAQHATLACSLLLLSSGCAAVAAQSSLP